MEQRLHELRARARRWGARRGDERGVLAIELIGFVAVTFMVLTLALQGIFFAQTYSAAQEAARNGARALSAQENYYQAATDSLPSWAHVVSVNPSTGGEARVEVTVRVPLGLPGITSEHVTVTRDAVFPMGG